MEKELKEMLKVKSEFTIISSTTRSSPPFLILPPKNTRGLKINNILISNTEIAKRCFKLIDGKAEKILIDVERKKPVDLWKLAKDIITKSKIYPIKPNDATLEAAYILTNRLFNYDLATKKIFIIGAGNIGTKLVLRLGECNSQVYIYDKDSEKAKIVSKALNKCLPKYSDGTIISIDEETDITNYKSFFDGLISFVTAEKVVGEEYIDILKPNSFAIDGGINNFSPHFIAKAPSKGINKVRLDVRIAYGYSLLFLDEEVSSFFEKVMGKREVDDITIVAGGVIGDKGDIVVDRIKEPSKVLGVANGIGGLFDELPREFVNRKRVIEEKIKEGLID